MQVAVMQDAFRPGDVEGNARKILAFYKKAVERNVDIVVLPAQSLCGNDPGDLLHMSKYSDLVVKMLKKLVKSTESSTALVLDTLFTLDGAFLPMYVVAYDGCIHHSFPWKRGESNPFDSVFEFRGKKILLAGYSNHWFGQMMMGCQDMEEVDMCLLSISHTYATDQENSRRKVFSTLATKVETLVVASQSGAHFSSDYEVMVGCSTIYYQGKIRKIARYFEEDSLFYDTEKDCQLSPIPDDELSHDELTRLNHDALVCAIRDYFRLSGIDKAVLGLSGGIDSSVVLPLAVEALGRKNVFGIMMPSQFSTDHSVQDAVKLAENLQIYYEIIPIAPLYDVFMKQLEPVFKGTEFGLAEENLQARIRGNLLMAVANKKGAMVLNTSNKSEACCGYGTMYGDLCGGLSVLGDLYKSQVYDLARYINRKKEIIPIHCIEKAPSAELRPNQKDSDSLPDYDLIEKILRSHLEKGMDEPELIKAGLDAEAVKRVLKLLYRNEYKRRQTPPVIQLSSTVLGGDIHIPVISGR